LLLACVVLSAPIVWSAEDMASAERELAEITERLNALNKWFATAGRRQREWQRELKSTDQAVANAATRLQRVSEALEALEVEMAELATERELLEDKRQHQAARIGEHLAAAYRLSGEDFIKLLLNQEDPEQLDRMVRYHQYFSEARGSSLAGYADTLADIAVVEREREARQADLVDQQTTLEADRATLVERRHDREKLLASLDVELKNKTAQKDALVADQARLESLIEELARLAQALDGTSFKTAKGKLPWPIAGPVRNAFGQSRAGGNMRWQGIFINATEGNKVAAIHRGRVAFADWLRGFGLLTIIDHGSGFMSLYGNADVLYKQPGDWVEGGETIASAGKSGGQTQSGVYFEIRSEGRPRDPISWLVKR
jgi:septal ring factor EnvC (AmiA/AmiB activator)